MGLMEGDKAVSRWSGYTVTIRRRVRQTVRAEGYATTVLVYVVEFDDGSRGVLCEADLTPLDAGE